MSRPSEVIDITGIRSAALRAIYEYYQSLAPDRPLPGRQHIDPFDLRTLLPHLVLADVVGDDFRIRLVGTRVVEIWGRDHTGLFFDDLPRTRFVEKLRRSYVRARDEKRIIHTIIDRPLDSLLFYERLTFPLGRDGQTVDMVMGAVDVAYSLLSRSVTFQPS